MNINQMIKINVCGRMFETTIETISSSGLFKNMIDELGEPTEAIFINRSPKIFEHVLAFLIDPEYLFPSKYENELKYFLIDYNNLYDKFYDIETKIDTIPKGPRGEMGPRGYTGMQGPMAPNNK